MPSSACPPWQTDKPASPAGERNDQLRSYTTSGDTIAPGARSGCTLCRKARYRSTSYWKNALQPGDFGFSARTINYSGGVPGDVGLFITWPGSALEHQ